MKKLKISLILNIIIFILTVIATIMMFTGFKFMKGMEPVLEATGFSLLKFFTVESNLFVGIISLIFSIKEIKIIKGNEKELSTKMYLLKYMSTSAVSLTFFIVFSYLGPISKGGIISMLTNSNLFFHLIIPVLSIINFTIFEKTNKINFKQVIYGIIPTFLYGLYYCINVLTHIENGKVSYVYDWYWFIQNGVWTAIIVIPVIFLISYLISLCLWYFNKKGVENG